MQRAQDGKEAPHLWRLLFKQHWFWLFWSVGMQGTQILGHSPPVSMLVGCLEASAMLQP